MRRRGVGYQRYLMDALEHPNAFNNPMHSFDYCNVVNTWIRTYESPHQVKGPFMVARFVNDAIRDNAMFPRHRALACRRVLTFARGRMA